MTLAYLDFDFNDEESGRGSFDAMAGVAGSRLALVLAEISSVLQWAAREFGAAEASTDDGDWDFDVRGTVEPDTALAITVDMQRLAASAGPVDAGALVTVTFTLSGSAAFCDAFREAFPPAA